jgi:hypothetical protein
MTKHTDGPWTVERRLDEGYRVCVAGNMGEPIADVDEWYDAEQTEANARLLAAAPELLEALEAVMERYQGTDGCRASPCSACDEANAAKQSARAAISKARDGGDA